MGTGTVVRNCPAREVRVRRAPLSSMAASASILGTSNWRMSLFATNAMTWLKHQVRFELPVKDSMISLRHLIIVLLEDALSHVMPRH